MPPALRKEENEPKKRDRRSLSYDFKHEVLKRLESGAHRSVIARELGLADSTIRYIIKNAHKIKNHFSESTSSTTKRFYARVSLYDALDKRLYSFIEDLKLKNMVPITQRMICEEAKRLFSELKETHKGPKQFYATSGWFVNFERRAMERNIDITGRSNTKSCTATFDDKVKDLLQNKKYPPELVFNITTTEFYWKRYPSCISSLGYRDYISRKNATNERVTLLLGGNAKGECLLPPLVVHNSKADHDDYSSQQLPVIWRSDADLRVTKDILDDWYLNYLCPFVKHFCLKNNLETKALLILDSSVSVPTDADSIVSVEVMVAPRSFQLPMEKALSTFRVAYYDMAISQMLNDVNVQCSESLCQWLESFNISKCVSIIGDTWRQMEPCVLNGVWNELWLQAVTWTTSGLADKDATVRAIVDKITAAGLANISIEEIDQLVSSPQYPVHDNIDDNADLPSHNNDMVDDYNNDSLHSPEGPAEQEDDVKLTTEVLETALNHIDTAFELLEQHDTNWERISSVRRTINDSVAGYKKILIERRKKPKQNTIYGFLKSVTRKLSSPEPEED